MDYTSSLDQTATIKTAFTYGNGNQITELDKTNNGSEIPEFSYLVSGDSIEQDGGAIAVTRTGSMDGESGNATLQTTIGGVVGYSAETTSFSRGLITSDTVRLVTDTLDSSATTSYSYANTDTSFYSNGAPKWGKVGDVTNPDGSWVHNIYDPSTGWLTDQYTPFKSSVSADNSSRHVVFDYNAADSGGGDGVDANSLVPLPRKTTTSIGGTVVNVGFLNYQQQGSGSSQQITRQGSSATATWANAALSSTTTLTGYDSYTLIGPLGTTTHAGTAVSNSTTQKSIGGAQLSSENTTTNPFGGLTTGKTSTSSSIGQGPVTVTPGSGGTPDPFGRTTQVTANSALTAKYSNYDWLGPHLVTDPTGENTNYTYTPTGQVATATIYRHGNHSVTTTYTYDAAGNVIGTTQEGTTTLHDGTIQTLSITTSASYDVLGRLVSSTDANGRTTSYSYVVNQLGTLVTTTLPDGTTKEFQQYALDGTLLSTTGSAVADPSTGDEGVVTTTLNEPGNATIPAGSTWTLTSTNNGSDWTKIYTNLLGQQFYTQQSGANGATLSTYTTYDGNGRPVTFQDVDGSVTHTDYNPADDSVLDTWVDMNGNGVYDPGVDSKTTNTVTPSTTDPTASVGTTQKALSASGNQVTQALSSNSGLNTTTTSNGLTTSSSTTLTGSDGTVTVTTTNPDNTQTVDSYTEGLLMQEQQLGTDHTTVITTVSYYYDALRRNIEVDDWTGKTTFQLRDDGSVESMTLPDGRTETVNSQDPNTQAPTDVTRLDGQQQSQSISSAGQTTGQSGAGVTPASYGYDPVTGKLSSLTIFPSGDTSNTAGQEITGFKYDPATGLESKKTYADGSTDTFTYNNKLQLTLEGLRGGISVSFDYNKAGMQTGATYIGGDTPMTIYDSLGTIDDLGRSHVMTELTTAANGQSTSTSDVLSYTPQGQVASETQASGVTVHYDYYAASDTSGTASPGSIKDMQLIQGGQVISETDYAYDSGTKRLKTITVNGVPYTIGYQDNSNVVGSVATANNTVGYTYVNGHLQEISADAGSQPEYDAQYTYTKNEQRLTENVLQENPETQALDQRNWTFNYDDQDQLQSVTDNGVTLYSYPYNAIGNRTDAGSVNTMNQYASFHYNGRGDVTDDGQFSYTWDAKDRLVAVEPDSPNAHSQKDVFTYDPQNRRTQEDIYSWDAANQEWVYASSLKFVYNGNQMVAELDGQNHLLQSYAWGPTGTLLSITDYTGGAPTNYQVVTDGSGSVVELLDSTTGLVAASYQYDPWGNPTSATGPAGDVSPFRWQGEFYDASFGGYYMGAREGSARLHIFLSPDPSGEASDPNLYRMAGNDPINKTDPSGLLWSQVFQYYNELGAKYVDPIEINLVGKIFGPGAAETAAENAAAGHAFVDEFVERTDFVRQMGNIVDHPIVSFHAAGNAIDTKIAEVKQAYNETGSIRIATGELVGTNQWAAGIENAYVIGPPRAVGNGWDRFNAIGNGTASTLNTVSIVGTAGTNVVGFGRSLVRGMQVQEAQLSVNLSTSARAVGSESAAAISAQQTAVESQGFVGPTIGRSGYRTAAEFEAAVGAKYQQLVDQGYAQTMKGVAQGLVQNDPMVIGSKVDVYARTRMRDWLSNAENIQEGQGRLIQVNRRLYDPSGSGKFRIPDTYISATQSTYDATIAEKTSMMAQTKDFYTFSGGGNVTIVRPSTLVTPGAQGSYGLIFP